MWGDKTWRPTIYRWRHARCVTSNTPTSTILFTMHTSNGANVPNPNTGIFWPLGSLMRSFSADICVDKLARRQGDRRDEKPSTWTGQATEINEQAGPWTLTFSDAARNFKENTLSVSVFIERSAISPIDRGLAIQSGSSKAFGKIVGVYTKKWLERKRSPAYPAVIGYLTTWLGKVKTAKKGTGYPTSQCRWSSTVKALSFHSPTAELLRGKPN
jgi:hypothetical protein